jgi:hypothetical protein
MGAGNFDRQPSSRPLTGKTTVFTLNTASQATSAFGTQTYQIRVATSATPCWVQISDGAATATTTGSMEIGTNVVDYFTVTPGQSAAVIAASSSGSVSITEMT